MAKKTKEEEERFVLDVRIALRADGKLFIYDEEGNRTTLEEKTTANFIDAVKDAKLTGFISLHCFKSATGPLCKVWYPPNICFWVDCLTGQYVRPCRPGEY
jgi:hypothetical protein